MNFIGVDLAWKISDDPRARTGLAAIDGTGCLIDVALATDDEEILKFIQEHADNSCAVGIDAPLVVPNKTGQRPVENILLRRRIAAYPANRNLFDRLYGGVRGEVLVKKLASEGFVLATNYSESSSRVIFEVFPSAAYKTILGLSVKVKRRKSVGTSEIQAGLIKIRDKLIGNTLKPPLHINDSTLDKLVSKDVRGLRGNSLDQFGDILDAILCAYIIYRYFLDRKSTEIIGDLEKGYILLPRESIQ